MDKKRTLINNIDHIGIAVNDLDLSLHFYTHVLQLDVEHIEVVKREHVKVAFINVGSVLIELLEPTSEHSPIYSFLKKFGEGIHHIAFHVDDIYEQFNIFKRKNIAILNDITTGAKQKKIFFVHPKESSSVLYEFCSDV